MIEEKITVDKLIDWLKEIPNPEEVELNIIVGRSLFSLKRIIYGEIPNYSSDGNDKRFVIPIGMGQHIIMPELQDREFVELGQMQVSKEGGENLNFYYTKDGKTKLRNKNLESLNEFIIKPNKEENGK